VDKKMSQEFSITKKTLQECEYAMHLLYGYRARLITQNDVPAHGISGWFGKKEVEIKGYVVDSPLPQIDMSKFSITKKQDNAAGISEAAQLALAKTKILENAPVKTEKVILEVLNAITNLEEKFDKKINNQSASDAGVGASEHENIALVRELMERNEFSEKFITYIVNQIKKDFTLERLADFNDLQNQVLEWIGKRISIFDIGKAPAKKTRIITLVGPTGAGKTTTVAKLAAMYLTGKIDGTRKKIGVITIDVFRIGAKEQTERYCSLMGLQFFCCQTAEEVETKIALLSAECDVIIIDTIGKSPKESVQLAEMQEILRGAGPQAEVHLAISATTKTKDIYKFLGQFEPFNYQSVIVTKMDETESVGNIIAALHEKNKSVSFITNGQGVPNDIIIANPVEFIINLEGFSVDRDRIDKVFS
jgi:flagellar biosynthesis protein FlhF